MQTKIILLTETQLHPKSSEFEDCVELTTHRYTTENRSPSVLGLVSDKNILIGIETTHNLSNTDHI